ncbi:hypothetical protein AeMF1_009067 [Aphanomyces euteiches]|nr:hypothetical protein AeMF1_009067 [Aphanomyces euteiches]
MVMADSTGKKYPLFLVLKTSQSKIRSVVDENLRLRQGFGKQLWKDVEPLQDKFNYRMYGNPTAWRNGQSGVEFLRIHFSNRPDRETKKVLLKWDDFSAHFTDEVLACASELNVVLEKIPPRFTWVCQPADVAWIRPIKSFLRRMWIRNIRRQVKVNRTQNVAFKLQPPKRPTLIRWITDAWSSLSDSTIKNGFAKCKILQGRENEVEPLDPVVTVDMLTELMARSVVDDIIDPNNDIPNEEDIDS